MDGSQDRTDTVFRRRCRLEAAWLTAGLAATAVFTLPAAAQTNCAPGTKQLIVYHAGSLSAAFAAVETLFTQKTGTCITDVAAGSLDAARLVTAGRQPTDIFAAADALDIDLLLKPAHYADYTIVFAEGRMVLAYTTSSREASTIVPAGAPFDPPSTVPLVAGNWYDQLAISGVLIGGSNPFLDPSGYRADLIFQLAALRYRVPVLNDLLLEHYTIARPGDVLGTSYDYQFIYESSAFANWQASPSTYRYARLPTTIGLSSDRQELRYDEASIVVPGLGLPRTAQDVRIPGTRVTWGLTILRTARHPAEAVQFLQLLFSQQGVALQTASGPPPVRPPEVSAVDYARLPAALKPLVSIEP